MLVFTEGDLRPGQDLPLDVHFGVHDQIELHESFLLLHCHVNRRRSLTSQLSYFPLVQLLDHQVVVEVHKCLIHELLARFFLDARLLLQNLPLLLLLPLSVQLEVLHRKSPVCCKAVLEMPMLLLSLQGHDAAACRVWSRQLQLFEILIAFLVQSVRHEPCRCRRAVQSRYAQF